MPIDFSKLPEPGPPDRIRRVKLRLQAFSDGFSSQTVVIPAWGYLEGLELRFSELVSNMDASMPYRFTIGGDHGPWPFPEFELYAVVRDVLDLGEELPPQYERPGAAMVTCPACEAPLELRTDVLNRRER